MCCWFGGRTDDRHRDRQLQQGGLQEGRRGAGGPDETDGPVRLGQDGLSGLEQSARHRGGRGLHRPRRKIRREGPGRLRLRHRRQEQARLRGPAHPGQEWQRPLLRARTETSTTLDADHSVRLG